MDLNEKTGQPSMEEILASIRRIIAEEPGAPGSHEPSTASHAAGESLIDEAADFELPSMFRPANGQTASERPQPATFGRLTDALRLAANGATNGAPAPILPLTPITDPLRFTAANGSATNGNVIAVAPLRQSELELPSLSQLRAVRQEAQTAADPQRSEPAADTPLATMSPQPIATQPPAAQPFAAEPVVAEIVTTAPSTEAPVKRQMAPFKDTRFSRMSFGQAPSAPVAPAPVAAAPAPMVGAPAPIVAVEPTPAAPEPVTVIAAFPAAPVLHVEAPLLPQQAASETPAARLEIQPPPMPLVTDVPSSLGNALVSALQPVGAAEVNGHSHATANGNGSIEDTAAELLRPMLRQWLAENMPRMVEKALFIEVAESVKTGRPATH